MRLHFRDLRLGGGDIGRCLSPRGAIIIVHNLDNELPGTDLVKILHRDGTDIAGDLGAERGEIGLQISVVSRLVARFPFPAVPLGEADDEDNRRHHEAQCAPDQSRDFWNLPLPYRGNGRRHVRIPPVISISAFSPVRTAYSVFQSES